MPIRVRGFKVGGTWGAMDVFLPAHQSSVSWAVLCVSAVSRPLWSSVGNAGAARLYIQLGLGKKVQYRESRYASGTPTRFEALIRVLCYLLQLAIFA